MSRRSVDRPERSRRSVDHPESSHAAGDASQPIIVKPWLCDFLRNPGPVAQNFTNWLADPNGAAVRVSSLNGHEYSRQWFDSLSNTEEQLPSEIVDLCMGWLRQKLVRDDCRVVAKWKKPNRKYIVPSQFYELFYQHSTSVGWGSEEWNYPSRELLSYALGDSEWNIPSWFDAHAFIFPGCINVHWSAVIVDLVSWKYIEVDCDPTPDDLRVSQRRNHVRSILTDYLYYYLMFTAFDEGGEVANWLLPIIPLDLTDSPTLNDLTPLMEEKLVWGAWYEKKRDLYIAVALWHMENRFEFLVDRSSPKRAEYLCRRSENCPFVLKASVRDGGWQVYKINLNHTCNLDFSTMGLRRLRSLAVAAYFAKKMHRQRSIMKPKDIIIELLQEFGIQASYSSALRARNTAVSIIYGGQADSFQMLPRYLYMLKDKNPGTMTDLQVGPDERFRYVFVALGACHVAFNAYLRPVIVVDGTHLKGRNKGVMFVAVTKDGNEQLFPLAIGIGPIKNNESWNWFLSRVSQAFVTDNNLVIILDQHPSIANAVQNVFPEAAHCICFYHLLKNLSSHGKAVANLYRKAAYAYRRSTYEKAIAKILEIKPLTHERLMEAGPERWARSCARLAASAS